MKHYDVYGIGNALVDNDYTVSDAFLSELTIAKNSQCLINDEQRQQLTDCLQNCASKKNGGGSLANALTMIQQLGGQCFFQCRLADDANGRHYQNQMDTIGMAYNSTSAIVSNGLTGTCFVFVTPDGQRTMLTHLGVAESMSPPQLEIAAIAASEYVFLEGYLTAQTSAYQTMVMAQKTAQQLNKKVALSLSDVFITTNFQPQLQTLIHNQVDILFCNEQEARSYTGSTATKQALHQLGQDVPLVIMTRGAQGVMLFDQNHVYEIRGRPVTPVVDTVGAGDVFAGTFLYALCRQRDVESAAEMANYAASQIVRQFTARFTKTEVMKLQQQGFA